MNKKLKIAYWVTMALLAAVCIVNIIKDCHLCVAISGISLVWLALCYMLARVICTQGKTIKESAKRESIRQQEFNKMRERAQNAEKQLQQMIDDTPARGENGRFVKRNVE